MLFDFALCVAAKPIRAGHAPVPGSAIRGGGGANGPVSIRGGGAVPAN